MKILKLTNGNTALIDFVDASEKAEMLRYGDHAWIMLNGKRTEAVVVKMSVEDFRAMRNADKSAIDYNDRTQIEKIVAELRGGKEEALRSTISKMIATDRNPDAHLPIKDAIVAILSDETTTLYRKARQIESVL